MTKFMRDHVQRQYGSVAQSTLSGNDDGVRAVAEAFGYSPQDLAAIPAEANMGLSCGNPTASASLKPGEVVVDLGCGGGLDVFLAAQKVGPSGKAIGIDMTEAMIERARANAQGGPDQKPYENVEFHLATIDNLPLEDDSVDCVISNCVINLTDDKQAVFNEIARVLKSGGRVAVSDIVLKQALPCDLKNSVRAYTGCIAGAIPMDDYKTGLEKAGLAHVTVIDSGKDLNTYAKIENQVNCCTPPKETASDAAESAPCCCGSKPADPNASELLELMQSYNLNDYAASAKVFATKP